VGKNPDPEGFEWIPPTLDIILSKRMRKMALAQKELSGRMPVMVVLE
jgi:hypothetical protein